MFIRKRLHSLKFQKKTAAVIPTAAAQYSIIYFTSS